MVETARTMAKVLQRSNCVRRNGGKGHQAWWLRRVSVGGVKESARQRCVVELVKHEVWRSCNTF